jgi:hypothetical protein
MKTFLCATGCLLILLSFWVIPILEHFFTLPNIGRNIELFVPLILTVPIVGVFSLIAGIFKQKNESTKR